MNVFVCYPAFLLISLLAYAGHSIPPVFSCPRSSSRYVAEQGETAHTRAGALAVGASASGRGQPAPPSAGLTLLTRVSSSRIAGTSDSNQNAIIYTCIASPSPPLGIVTCLGMRRALARQPENRRIQLRTPNIQGHLNALTSNGESGPWLLASFLHIYTCTNRARLVVFKCPGEHRETEAEG